MELLTKLKFYLGYEVIARCGHQTRKSDFKNPVEVFGEMVLPPVCTTSDDIRWCIECCKQMAIRCADCGTLIWPWSQIHLRPVLPTDEPETGRSVRVHTIYDLKGEPFVDCLVCCPESTCGISDFFCGRMMPSMNGHGARAEVTGGLWNLGPLVDLIKKQRTQQ